MNFRDTPYFLVGYESHHAVAQLVEALRYKPEGCWIEWNLSLT